MLAGIFPVIPTLFADDNTHAQAGCIDIQRPNHHSVVTMKTCPLLITTLVGMMLCLASTLPAQEEEPARLGGDELKKALNDSAADFWIYDDLEKAYSEGKRTGKPVLVSFRCVP